MKARRGDPPGCLDPYTLERSRASSSGLEAQEQMPPMLSAASRALRLVPYVPASMGRSMEVAEAGRDWELNA